MNVELLGYSERGVINAICEDIHHSPDPHARLAEFISWFDFLEAKPNLSGVTISKAFLLVEQSFSQFGDLDLLILVELTTGQRLSFFIEAKVTNDTNSWTTIDSRWNEFTEQLTGKADNTSNLFVQLHRKVRLVEKLRDERNFTSDCLIPEGKLGNNQIVEKACNKLKEFLSDEGAAWFGAILPDTQEALSSFARSHIGAFPINNVLSTWNAKQWGLLSWHYFATTVNKDQWPRTKATLDWNEGQIFRHDSSVRADIRRKSVALHNGYPVYVVDCGKHYCRVIPLEAPDTGYFWQTSKVRVTDLVVSEDQELSNEPYLPRSEDTYIWDSRNELPPFPKGEPVCKLVDGTAVVVLNRPSWHTTPVKMAQGPSDIFYVFTHQLRRVNVARDEESRLVFAVNKNNIFTNIPAILPNEITETLVQAQNVRIERIVSQGHITPSNQWYDQPENEFILVLQGYARLRFEDEIVEMKAGDWINIPAHRKHGVDWTTPEEQTIWLAVFYN